MKIPCLECKGRYPKRYCGREFCPIYSRKEFVTKAKQAVKEDFAGSSPAPFVGRFGYPYINVGILSTVEVKEDAWLYDSPRYWAEHNFQIPELIDLRSSLVNSRFKVMIKDRNKFLDISQEIGMASKPVELELSLKQKPRFKLNLSLDTAPHGPRAILKKAEITSNPKISYKVDKVVSDIDLKANDAMLYLYDHDFDENFLSRLLSVGNIGMKTQRKLVPTRWSITAVDDAIGKNLIKETKDFKESDYCAYFGGYLGNYYLILFFPEVWSYELFETYAPSLSKTLQYTTDYESYEGRKKYAEATAGGYYAARLAILEKLKNTKKQASVLALRFITNEYFCPLGVWVVRQATRNAMKSKPIYFSSEELMLKYAGVLIKKRFGFDLDRLLEKSVLLKRIKTQSKLIKFI